MYSHILVPVAIEHGNRGATAIKIATKLLSEGGKITLYHVMEDVPAYAASYLPHGLRDAHRKEATTELEKLAGSVSADCAVIVDHGHSSTTILQHAADHGVDCIVLASHKPGFEDYFLGSTAARVVRHARCSVHILR